MQPSIGNRSMWEFWIKTDFNLNELEKELIEEKFLLYQAVLYTELIKKKNMYWFQLEGLSEIRTENGNVWNWMTVTSEWKWIGL